MALLLLIDQYTKFMAVTHLKDNADYIIAENIFRFQYLENRGAAFGMLPNQRMFFVFSSMVMLTIIVYVLVKTPSEKKYVPINALLITIAAGAIGNMIDRIKLGYVVDFLYFEYINFPIFNVADICVSVGTALLVLFVLFYYKEEDLKFLKMKIQKNNLRY